MYSGLPGAATPLVIRCVAAPGNPESPSTERCALTIMGVVARIMWMQSHLAYHDDACLLPTLSEILGLYNEHNKKVSESILCQYQHHSWLL